MKKKYILIKKYQKFYDGHGTPDDGASVVSVEFTDQYNNFDLTGEEDYDSHGNKFCEASDEIDYEEKDDDHYEFENKYQAENGYNFEIWLYNYKEITKEEYEQYGLIIEKYNSLFKV